MPRLHLYKWIALLLLSLVIPMGWMGEVPRKIILNESIRNLYFHVPMWFGMIFLLAASAWHSLLYLRGRQLQHDTWADSYALVGLLFGLLGLTTGMVWAQFTWGAWWSGDPKQNASAIALLMYLAYRVLRNSFPQDDTRARVSAVYNLFAFSCLIPLLFILPRLTDSLHPGNGGNPGFNSYDLDGRMRLVFYPAVLAFTLLGFWLSHLYMRLRRINQYIQDRCLS